MIFSRRCEYGIRALTHLAQSCQRCGAREISRDQKIPYHFTAKILQDLKAKGFVCSLRGSGGGFALARPPETICLLEVFGALECEQFLTHCAYGFPGCSDSQPCTLHAGWKPIRAQIEDFLRSHTIGDLVGRNPRVEKSPEEPLPGLSLPFPSGTGTSGTKDRPAR